MRNTRRGIVAAVAAVLVMLGSAGAAYADILPDSGDHDGKRNQKSDDNVNTLHKSDGSGGDSEDCEPPGLGATPGLGAIPGMPDEDEWEDEEDDCD